LKNKQYINYLKSKLRSEFSSAQETHESPRFKYSQSQTLLGLLSTKNKIKKKTSLLLQNTQLPFFRSSKQTKSQITFRKVQDIMY